MFRRFSAVSMIPLVLLTASTATFSEGVYLTPGECNSATFILGPTDATEIWVYLEDDFAQEMTACTPSLSDDGNVPEYYVRTVLESALEKWNQQSTGPVFHFAGTTNFSNPVQACGVLPFWNASPAVFVRFNSGCKDLSGYCAPSEPLATTYSLKNNCATITIWGDGNSLDTCTNDAYSFTLDPHAASGVNYSLETILIHELGHILGLGHSNDISNVITNDSVMRSVVVDGRTHLFAWEKDCLEFIRPGQRELYYEYAWYNYNASLHSGLPEYDNSNRHSYSTQRGTISGGSLGGTTLHSIYGLYNSYGYLDYADIPNLQAGGTSFSSYNSLHNYLLDEDVSPTLFSDYSDSNYPDRAYALYEGYHNYQVNSKFEYNPPLARIYQSSNHLNTIHGGTIVEVCNNSNCNSTTNLKSNLPLSTAYDPRTNQLITVSVETKYHSSGRITDGSIWVYAGYQNPSSGGNNSYKLNKGEQLSLQNNTSIYSSGSSLYEYYLETEHPVGVACTRNLQTFPYNCLLAWQERGVPSGRVAYTYFRIGSNHSIEWLGNAYIRGGSQTAAGVQAAFTAGDFYLTWKKWDGKNKVVITRTNDSYTSWSPTVELNAPGIIDIPTFFYYSYASYVWEGNQTVVWTTSHKP